jgi:hypothetical protein
MITPGTQLQLNLEPLDNTMAADTMYETTTASLTGLSCASPSITIGNLSAAGSTVWATNTNIQPTYTIAGGRSNFSTIGTTMGATVGNIANSTISLQGPQADIDINGRSLLKTLDALEQRLNMLTPNPNLEKEWDQLKKLGDRYRKLEKQCENKAAMWTKLKNMPKIDIE